MISDEPRQVPAYGQGLGSSQLGVEVLRHRGSLIFCSFHWSSTHSSPLRLPSL